MNKETKNRFKEIFGEDMFNSIFAEYEQTENLAKMGVIIDILLSLLIYKNIITQEEVDLYINEKNMNKIYEDLKNKEREKENV